MTILNWKSIAKVKTFNSNSISAKAISIIGNSKAIIDIRQLRIRSCENAVLNSQLPLRPPPSPNIFTSDVDQFIEQANKFHPTAKFTAEISENEIT